MCKERQSKIDEVIIQLRRQNDQLETLRQQTLSIQLAAEKGYFHGRQDTVKAVQSVLGVDVDGIPGPKTRGALRALGL